MMTLIGTLAGYLCNIIGFVLIWSYALGVLEMEDPEAAENLIASFIGALLIFVMVKV